MKAKIILWNGLISVWAVPRDPPLLHGGLTEAKLLLYRYAIALLYNIILYGITKEIPGI